MKKKMIMLLLSSMMISCLAGCGQTLVSTNSNTNIKDVSTVVDSDIDDTKSPEKDLEKPDQSDDRQSDKVNIDSHELEHSGKASAKFIETTDYEKDVEHSLNNITTILDDLSESKDNSENVILSETSLNMALGMLLVGANEGSECYDDLISYLDKSNYVADPYSIVSKNNALMNLYSEEEMCTLKLANSVWSHNDREFTTYFINNMKAYYNAEATSLDFTNHQSVDIINDWVSDNTNGTIDSIVSDGVLAQSKSVLINALYFLGDWEKPFTENQCHDGEFTNADGSVSNITFMNESTDIYYESDAALAFFKSYSSNGISFVGILPKDDGDFNVSDLDIDTLLENPVYGHDVYYKIPKFKIEDTNSLASSLAKNGLASIFVAGDDFTAMCDQAMIVSDVIQKTYVDVNEKGTEASAVTAIITKNMAMPGRLKDSVVINLDRPFVFMIYDEINNECLFIGKVNSL